LGSVFCSFYSTTATLKSTSAGFTWRRVLGVSGVMRMGLWSTHYLLQCVRWACRQAQTLGDLIDWGSASASLKKNILGIADLQGDFVDGTLRLEF